MSVPSHEIARLAALARLPLALGDAETLRADLDAILAHVRTLDALAHRSTQPFVGTGPERARLREDGGLPDAMLLSADALAPEWEDGFFIVPRLSSHADTPLPMPPASMVGAAVQWAPVVESVAAPRSGAASADDLDARRTTGAADPQHLDEPHSARSSSAGDDGEVRG